MKKSSSIFLLCYLLCAPCVFAGEAFDRFGHSVSISGDTVVAGSYGDDDNGDESGSAYVYAVMTDPVFTQVKKLGANNGTEYDVFGVSVSISGDTLVVGARDGDGRVADTGSAYIFDRNYPTANAWKQRPKIFAVDGEDNDGFGYSVSISGDTLVVGARDGDGSVADSGSAYIFYRNQDGANNWGQVKKIFEVNGEEDDEFGISVSISGDTVVVGARFDDYNGTSSGSAYIFDRNQDGADNWGLVQKIVAGDGATSDQFGASVSISGDTLVVGALYDYHHSSPQAGSAYIFDRNYPTTNAWGQRKKIIASDYATSDQFGVSVSIDGDMAVVGAFYGNGITANTGSAYIFDRNYPTANAWGQRKKIIADSENAALGEMFGISVSISVDTVVVGANFDDSTGSAYIFDRNLGGADNWGQVQRIVAADARAMPWILLLLIGE